MVHREMVDCFRQIGDDSDCRAVVLTGAGKIFTAGWGKYYYIKLCTRLNFFDL